MKLPPLPPHKMYPARNFHLLPEEDRACIMRWCKAVSLAPMNIWDRLPKKKRDYWHSIAALSD
jgi:hypothetical protein